MIKIIKIIFAATFLQTIMYAQPGTVDMNFNPSDIGYENGDGANGTVYSSSLQSDGKIIIGGDFTKYNGINMSRIARLNDNGEIDFTFGYVEVNNTIFDISIQNDGKIIIVGNFTSVNGVTRNRIARLNNNGTLDITFGNQVGANNIIHSTSIQNDGKIIIGGEFTSYNGITTNRIARLNIDGTLDNSFITSTGANSAVLSTSLQNDGKIIISGWFTFYNGISRNRIARLNTDGTLDSSFNPVFGNIDWILFSCIQSDGKIIIGGDFSILNSTTINRIARLNTDGTLDSSFNTGSGTDNSVNSISIQNDGKIIIGGNFTSFNGIVRNGIARLNINGSLDSTFNPGSGAANFGTEMSNKSVNTTLIGNNGKIIIGGKFTLYNSTIRNKITQLNANGTLDFSFNAGTGANGTVNATVIQNDGKIIIGGEFSTFNGIPRNGIVRLNVDGTVDTSFNVGTGFTGTGIGIQNYLIPNVATISIQNDGKIVVGGNFSTYNDNLRPSIIRLNTDGSRDQTFNPTAIIQGNTLATAIQSDGKILIGGTFNINNSTGNKYIARLNTDGSLDSTFDFNNGPNNVVRTISIQNIGKIIIGGSFTTYNGYSRNRIVRINTDGSVDLTFNYVSGANNIIHTTAIQSDKKIIIGGQFTTYNGISINRIARLNIDGTLDGTFNTGFGANGNVFCIGLQSDEKIIIGGSFIEFNNINRKGIARLNTNGQLDTSFDPGAGISNINESTNISTINFSIYGISIQNDGKIIIGGYFSSFSQIGRNRVARINGDNNLDFNDFELNYILVYPNPNKGVFKVHLNNFIENKYFDIYTIYGQKIFSKVLDNNDTIIDMAGQPEGLYIYNFYGDNGKVKTGKVILN